MSGIFHFHDGSSSLPAINVIQNAVSQLGLSQTLERDGSEWVRSVINADILEQSFSEFYGESIVSNLVLASIATSDAILNASVSSTIVLAQSVNDSGGRVASESSQFVVVYDSGGPSASEGLFVYIDSSDGEAKLASFDGEYEVAGMLASDYVPGQNSTVKTEGKIELGDWTDVAGTATLTPGATYYLASNGQMTTTLPITGRVVVLGRALKSLEFDLEIDIKEPNSYLYSLVYDTDAGLVEPPSLLNDTFTDPNGTNVLSGHVGETGHVWSRQPASVSTSVLIHSNRAYAGINSWFGISDVDVSANYDYTSTAHIYIHSVIGSTSNRCGVTVRTSTTSPLLGYSARLRNGSIEFQKMGVGTLATVSLTLVVGETYTLSLTCSGSTTTELSCQCVRMSDGYYLESSGGTFSPTPGACWTYTDSSGAYATGVPGMAMSQATTTTGYHVDRYIAQDTSPVGRLGPAIKGLWVYIDSATGEAKAATSEETLAKAEVAGVAIEQITPATAGSFISSGYIELPDWTSIASVASLTPGVTYYLTTAGLMSSTPPVTGYVVTLGRAMTAQQFDVDIRLPVGIT